MLKHFKLINNILGIAVGIIASAVFLMTAEPTVSFWDCGEYIATACKLQVGHPPGAPTFQLIGCLFSLFAGKDVTSIAYCINAMSALCSGLTILFLFWSLTMLGKKLATAKGTEFTGAKAIAVFGSALVGSLAYTFTDTFWFSAVEGEVYAMSSFCTALVFWAALKWEQVADNNYSYRWIIFIAFVIGLSIGVHLLNLLTLPAIFLIVYYKKFKPTKKGLLYAILASFVAVGIILWGIIPGVVKYSGSFERLFTNGFGARFYTGTIFYFVAIACLLVWGLWYTEKKKKRMFNLGLLSLTFILIGYSTFLVLPIRSNANPPIDENNPEDAVALLAYLNRDQYGSSPLFYGQYFNSRVVDYKSGKPVYVRNYIVNGPVGELSRFYKKSDAEKFVADNNQKYNGNLSIEGKYVVSDTRERSEALYAPEDCTIFPRMWSSREDMYVRGYKTWAGISRPDADASGNPNIPTFGENLKFFFSYQMWYMYGRYFMWNFAGRQNLDQGMGGLTTGEWISGINFIDEARLGPQDMPAHMKNVGRTTYFFLPLILGLIGLIFQFRRDRPNWWVVLLLFLMTGVAIGVYLNMYAYQPRERDYAFAASFYAFAIWIGLGVYAIFDFVQKYINKKIAAVLATIVCMGIPTLLAAQNWKSHDRSNRYLTLSIAKSYLDSCEPNAILFASGDNDTFPLWYLQEVEGYRTDVRICNLSLMGTDWYFDQMKRKAYNSEPLLIKMTKEMYQQGTRDILISQNKIKTPQNLVNVMQEIYKPQNNQRNASIPTSAFYIDVDKEKVLANGTVPAEMADKIVDRIVWSMPMTSIYQTNGTDTIFVITKAYIGMMDILAHNNWDRPIYYVATTGNDAFFGLENYFQAEGMVYRLVPVMNDDDMGKNFSFVGRVNTDILYRNLMERYDYKQYADKSIFLSQDYTRHARNIKIPAFRLVSHLIMEGKTEKAEKVLDKIYHDFPIDVIPLDFFDIWLCELYLQCKTQSGITKGLNLLTISATQFEQDLLYYNKFKGEKSTAIARDKSYRMQELQQLNQICSRYLVNAEFEPYRDKIEQIVNISSKYDYSNSIQ